MRASTLLATVPNTPSQEIVVARCAQVGTHSMKMASATSTNSSSRHARQTCSFWDLLRLGGSLLLRLWLLGVVGGLAGEGLRVFVLLIEEVEDVIGRDPISHADLETGWAAWPLPQQCMHTLMAFALTRTQSNGAVRVPERQTLGMVSVSSRPSIWCGAPSWAQRGAHMPISQDAQGIRDGNGSTYRKCPMVLRSTCKRAGWNAVRPGFKTGSQTQQGQCSF